MTLMTMTELGLNPSMDGWVGGGCMSGWERAARTTFIPTRTCLVLSVHGYALQRLLRTYIPNNQDRLNTVRKGTAGRGEAISGKRERLTEAGQPRNWKERKGETL